MVRLVTIAFVLLLPEAAASQSMQIDQSGGSRPNPDPTVLGLAAQKEAISNVRDIFEAKLKAINDEVERIKAGLDKTDARLLKRIDDIPVDTAAQVATLRQLVDQRFLAVEQQFKERDARVDQIAVLNNVALQAALSAAKEAVAKQDQNVTKQLDQLYLNSNTVTKGQEIQINDLKAQFAAITARGSGQSDLFGWVIGAGGLVLAIVAFALTRSHASPTYYQPQPQPQPQVAVVPVVPVPAPPARG